MIERNWGDGTSPVRKSSCTLGTRLVIRNKRHQWRITFDNNGDSPQFQCIPISTCLPPAARLAENKVQLEEYRSDYRL